MKRILAFFLAIMLCFTGTAVFADEPKMALRTWIRAYIDYTPIESYLINDLSYIAVEDLVHYGFEVTYDEAAKSLNVSRIRLAIPMYTKEMWESAASKQVPTEIFPSDISVYLDGDWVNSYLLDGKVHIMLDELVKYGGFEWDKYSNMVSITIFQHELQQELDRAENVVEIEYPYPYRSAGNMKYIGQVDENGVPNGIGMTEFNYLGSPEQIEEKYLGYFLNGKPNGLVYRENFYTVSRTYTNRYLHFIGTVDGTKTATREIYHTENGWPMWYKEPNFGTTILPKLEIPGWTGPEAFPDRTVYTKGCYYEYAYGQLGTSRYFVWQDDNETQNILYRLMGERPTKKYLQTIEKENPNIRWLEDFYSYQNGVMTSHDGILHTRSGEGTEEDPVILNDPEAGSKEHHIIEVMVNGEEIDADMLPILWDNRVVVPLRRIAGKLGVRVEWVESTKTVICTKGEKTVTMQIDNPVVDNDGSEVTLDVAPLIFGGYTLVPVRAISEFFGAEVEWDAVAKQVTITKE